MSKIILDLCSGTGSWSKPYADAGYDVRLITLPDYDVAHFQPPENVHGILAAPPCTEFSLALGNRRKRDFIGAMRIVRACLHIIWVCRTEKELGFWCLENPRGFLRQFLGKPPLTVEYWQFGDAMRKPTDLWGYYDFPVTLYDEPPELFNQAKIKNIQGINGKDRAAVRAITPPGFANAFFKANQ